MQQQGPIIDMMFHSSAPAVLDSDGIRTWHAMRDSFVWFELPDLHWTAFEGDKAVDALNGLLTNDVASLQDGCSFYAAALTPKGKVVADMYVVRDTAKLLLVGVSARAFDGWWHIVRKYINPRLAKYRDERSTFVTFACTGPRASGVLSATMEPWQHASSTLASGGVRTLRMPVFGNVENFLVLAPADMRESLRAHFSQLGQEGHRAALDVARIEAGRPAWGIDMDDNTLAQEANMEELNAISFEKGCYTGQETVARVHFRGHVNRQLRGLRSTSLLAPGTVLTGGDGKVVGEVKSSAQSPAWGAIAIAMLRREVPSGATVVADGVDAVVCALPFGSDVEHAA